MRTISEAKKSIKTTTTYRQRAATPSTKLAQHSLSHSQTAREDRYLLMDGRVQLYLRNGSPNWQCACSVDGRQHRANTQEDGLNRATAFARDWYLAVASGSGAVVSSEPVRRPQPSARPRAGQPSPSAQKQTFREAANRFMVEFETFTRGQRNAIYVEGHRRRLANHLVPFFGDCTVGELTSGMIADYRIHRMNGGRYGKPPRPQHLAPGDRLPAPSAEVRHSTSVDRPTDR